MVFKCNQGIYRGLHPIYNIKFLGEIKGYGSLCSIRKNNKNKPYETGGKSKKYKLKKDTGKLIETFLKEISKDKDKGLIFFKDILQTKSCKIIGTQIVDINDTKDRVLSNIINIYAKLKSQKDRKLILSTLSTCMSNLEIQKIFLNVSPGLKELSPK